MSEVFYLQKDNIYAVPIVHYNMEFASQVRLAFDQIKPDCVAVELAETMELRLLHAASRLPDISVVISYDQKNLPLYYMAEPCDAAFEALRSALENGIPAHCIDLDVDYYPEIKDSLPDPYAIQRIGLKSYYEAYEQNMLHGIKKSTIDNNREMYMAKRLKELSYSYERILFIGGMVHVQSVLDYTSRSSFPPFQHAPRNLIEICTITEESCRDVLAEYGWVSAKYEEAREEYVHSKKKQTLYSPLDSNKFPLDRQKLNYQLYKEASEKYIHNTGNPFPGYNLRNTMKYVRNYALITDRLMPDLFQLLSAAKGCVDHNFAYEVWELATAYPYRRNVDGLSELDLTIEDIWGQSKTLRFHLREPNKKNQISERRKHRKDHAQFKFKPPENFNICSYPPEDIVVENFGTYLKKKGTQLLTEESARTVPFTTSIEDGLDTRETIRHWAEKKLYVKMRGKPPGGVGSVVAIFHNDRPEESTPSDYEKYPWCTTWLGEHDQESDMAFYATPTSANVIGPGISRCEYGGFMMSYPPGRMFDIWSDQDYHECQTKAEVLLMAAIDYAVKPLVVYVASTPPRSIFKSFARRFGKKLLYIPIGQLSPILINKIRSFHVLDGHDKRSIAGEYIF